MDQRRHRRNIDPEVAKEAWVYPLTIGHLILATTISAALAEAPWPVFMWIALPIATLTFNLAALMHWQQRGAAARALRQMQAKDSNHGTHS